jgi:hypothetical protein
MFRGIKVRAESSNGNHSDHGRFSRNYLPEDVRYDNTGYTGCLKIASTKKKTVASGNPKKSKKPIFNFLKQKG